MTSDHHPLSRSPDDQAGHPDLDALADLDAGLLDPATADGLTGHVGECPSCAATLRAFGAVRADLRSLSPPQLPDAVAARLDATLAELRTAGLGQEALSRPGAYEVGLPTSDDPPVQAELTPEDADSSSRPAVACLPAGDSRPARHGGEDGPEDGRPAPGPDDGTGADDIAAARERRRERSRRMTTLAAASVVALAAFGIGTAVLHGTQGGSSVTRGAMLEDRSGSSAEGPRSIPPSAPTRPSPTEIHLSELPAPAPTARVSKPPSVPHYTRQTLAADVDEIEQQASLGRVSAAGRAGPGGEMADSSRRRACAGSIPGAVGTLTAVRQVVFGSMSTPAFVFVYRDSGSGRRVFVVADDCGLVPGSAATVLYSLPD